MMHNRITLDVDHPNKKRMEYFLNQVNDQLEGVSFDISHWKLSQSIVAGYQFKNADQSLTITVIFSESYKEANDIAKANLLPSLPNARWGVNGDLLHFVESNDENRVSDILGLFAGEE